MYWDTQRWRSLFTGGRLLSDFRTCDDCDDGVRMSVQFEHHDDKRHLYAGLLIKLAVTCKSLYDIPRAGRDITASKRWYDDGYFYLKSCLVVKFSGKRIYYIENGGKLCSL